MLSEYVAVAILGGATGTAELLGRYRDAPFAGLKTAGAWIYVCANMAAAISALALIYGFQFEFAFDKPGASTAATGAKWWTRVLVAGVGAMAFFRSSVFSVRVGNADIAAGPAFIFQMLLTVADRDVDRARAQQRAAAVAAIMDGIDFDKSKAALPAHCFALMQNVTADEQRQFGLQHEALVQNSSIDPTIKSMLMGLALMNLVGEGVLRASVGALGQKIRI